MISRFKVVSKCYLTFLQCSSMRNFSRSIGKTNLLKHTLKNKSSNKILLLNNTTKCLTTKQDENLEQSRDDLPFWSKLLICGGVLLLSFYKFIEFAECEKQSKADKERCEIR